MAAPTAQPTLDTVIKFTEDASIICKPATEFSSSKVVVIVGGKEATFECGGVETPDFFNKFVSRVQAGSKQPNSSIKENEYVVNFYERASELTDGEKIADGLKKQAISFLKEKCPDLSVYTTHAQINGLDIDSKNKQKIKIAGSPENKLKLMMHFMTENITSKDEKALNQLRTKLSNSLKQIGIKVKFDGEEIKAAVKF
ncbi:hypothetical protein D5R81_00885 [Parashewanella spongiae]|uniref:Uncharacterized protein n=1 Tax=Parashewanella spongiae TaxID=342950 RepID=A0A3A6TT63_9GAMM|nr:hypothetical protein [Parashewanella spongiae]MCL1079988.1 hypothetical protein [Parashewanella spongiae]RJY19407.1 hypothetical protein D5R81_00885 [Parashewanella spongiae]